MPVTFRIHPEANLVYIRYFGQAGIAESLASYRAYAGSADFRPGQRHFFDFAEVTDYERDFPAFLAMQAEMAATYGQIEHDQIAAFWTPTPVAQEMARLAVGGWKGMPHMVLRVFEDRDEALEFLGLTHHDIAAL